MAAKLWDDPGPDSGWGWVIALAACWITFMVLGINRATGVLFVAVVENYGITRQEASWPFSLTPAVASFSAVFSSVLLRYMTARTGLTFGIVFAFVGLGLCYFANGIVWFIVGLGIFYGIGAALGFPMLTSILNEYFMRKRATANGIFLAGSTLGLFAMPPLIEYLLETYGLRGTMLVLSALTMNGAMGVALMRPRTAKQFPVLAEPSRKRFIDAQNAPRRPSMILEPSLTEMTLMKPRSYWYVFRSTVSEPMFYMLVFSALSCITPLLSLGMIVTDFGIDKGLPRERAVMLLSAGSIPELVGRLCIGWIADKGYIRYKNLFMVLKVFAGALMVALPFVNQEVGLFGIIAANSLLEGCAIVLINVLLVEYMGIERLAMAFSWSLFINGWVFLSLPILIGAFRDNGGSYAFLFYGLGLMSITAAISWLFEPLLVRRHRPPDVAPVA